LKLFKDDFKSDFPEKTTVIASTDISKSKLSLAVEKPNLLKKNIQSTTQNNQDITQIDYSQFRNKLIDKKDHNSTFQQSNTFIVHGNTL